ncbi:MAG: hypothetical protein AB1489_27265 [Acidobacteriota bacterium]
MPENQPSMQLQCVNCKSIGKIQLDCHADLSAQGSVKQVIKAALNSNWKLASFVGVGDNSGWICPACFREIALAEWPEFIDRDEAESNEAHISAANKQEDEISRWLIPEATAFLALVAQAGVLIATIIPGCSENTITTFSTIRSFMLVVTAISTGILFYIEEDIVLARKELIKLIGAIMFVLSLEGFRLLLVAF